MQLVPDYREIYCEALVLERIFHIPIREFMVFHQETFHNILESLGIPYYVKRVSVLCFLISSIVTADMSGQMQPIPPKEHAEECQGEDKSILHVCSILRGYYYKGYSHLHCGCCCV